MSQPFDESQHPRGETGRFTSKAASESDIDLAGHRRDAAEGLTSDIEWTYEEREAVKRAMFEGGSRNPSTILTAMAPHVGARVRQARAEALEGAADELWTPDEPVDIEWTYEEREAVKRAMFEGDSRNPSTILTAMAPHVGARVRQAKAEARAEGRDAAVDAGERCDTEVVDLLASLQQSIEDAKARRAARKAEGGVTLDLDKVRAWSASQESRTVGKP